MKDTNKYIPIDFFFLRKGLKIDCGIYYKNGNSFVLLYRNIVVDSKFLSDVMPFYSTHGGLYIDKEGYNKIQKENINILEEHMNDFDENFHKKLIKVKTMFTNITKQTEKLVNELKTKGTVNKKQANEIVTELSSTIKEENNDEAIFQCINEIKEADSYLYTHSINVATLNGLLGSWLGLDEVKINKLVKIGLMHDIGKLRVPQMILNKPGKLTDREFEIVKKHSVNSYNMLIEMGEFDTEVLEAVKFHHERENGSGYPSGLNSSEIPLFAKITAISDVYDAMVSKRCYKEPVSPFDVLQMLSLNKFSDLNYKLVNLFLEIVPMLLIRRPVILSDGSIGIVVYICQNNYQYPVVKVNDELIVTNENLTVISMYLPTGK